MSTTVIHGQHTELERWLKRRSELGLDTHDEMWDGELHVAPAEDASNGILMASFLTTLAPRASAAGLRGLGPFNLGVVTDYRVLDAAWIERTQELGTWMPTARAVLEVISPDEDPHAKLDFYRSHGVQEVWLAWAKQRRVVLHHTRSERAVEHSSVFGITVHDVVQQLDWP